jgi:hypothetical protein
VLWPMGDCNKVILRLVPDRAAILNSRERAPFLLFVETLELPDSSSEENEGLLSQPDDDAAVHALPAPRSAPGVSSRAAGDALPASAFEATTSGTLGTRAVLPGGAEPGNGALGESRSPHALRLSMRASLHLGVEQSATLHSEFRSSRKYDADSTQRGEYVLTGSPMAPVATGAASAGVAALDVAASPPAACVGPERGVEWADEAQPGAASPPDEARSPGAGLSRSASVPSTPRSTSSSSAGDDGANGADLERSPTLERVPSDEALRQMVSSIHVTRLAEPRGRGLHMVLSEAALTEATSRASSGTARHRGDNASASAPERGHVAAEARSGLARSLSTSGVPEAGDVDGGNGAEEAPARGRRSSSEANVLIREQDLQGGAGSRESVGGVAEPRAARADEEEEACARQAGARRTPDTVSPRVQSRDSAAGSSSSWVNVEDEHGGSGGARRHSGSRERPPGADAAAPPLQALGLWEEGSEGQLVRAPAVPLQGTVAGLRHGDAGPRALAKKRQGQLTAADVLRMSRAEYVVHVHGAQLLDVTATIRQTSCYGRCRTCSHLPRESPPLPADVHASRAEHAVRSWGRSADLRMISKVATCNVTILPRPPPRRACSLPAWGCSAVIVKSGDDCRQELLAMQLIRMFLSIFRTEHLPLWLRPYQVRECCTLLSTPSERLLVLLSLQIRPAQRLLQGRVVLGPQILHRAHSADGLSASYKVNCLNGQQPSVRGLNSAQSRLRVAGAAHKSPDSAHRGAAKLGVRAQYQALPAAGHLPRGPLLSPVSTGLCHVRARADRVRAEPRGLQPRLLHPADQGPPQREHPDGHGGAALQHL